MQKKVKQLAKQLQQKYLQNCTVQLSQCQIKTYNLCQGTGPRLCFQNFPSPTGCLNDGITLSKQSGVRVPNIFNINNLNYETRLFICESALIQQTFKRTQQDDNLQYSYSYIGSSSGAIRISPSFKQFRGNDGKKCIDYDPRIRPWYVSSITGRKTTIILFDISKTMTSMHPGTRFKNALITINIIFATLNSFDHIGFIIFSQQANTLPGFQSIFQATQDNKNLILQLINNIQTADGITNYTSAIQLGIQLLNQYKLSQQQKQNINCTSIIFLLLTDGYTENDPILSYYKNIPKLLQQNQYNKHIKLISFIYGIQQNIKYSLITNLTYQYNGILFRIIDGIDNLTMIQKLSSYYAFISEGLERRIEPIWSQPYYDAFGFGTIMSVTIPVYVQNLLPKIIGVAGIDVLISRFQNKYPQITNNIIQQLFIKIPQCQQTTLDNITLQYLRCKAKYDDDRCINITNVSDYNNNLNLYYCDRNISFNVFKIEVQDSYMDQSRCCGPTLNMFYIILGCSFLGGFGIIGVIILYRRGLFGYLWNRKWRKNRVRLDNDGSENFSQDGLIDPQNKYKIAEEDGVRIYHQPQFML